MKKVISKIIAVTIFLSFLVSPVLGMADKRDMFNNYEYNVNEEGNAILSHYIGKETKVTIPDEVDGKKVVMIADGAFHPWKKVKSISIPDTVTISGRNPFAENDLLQELYVSPTSPTMATIDGVLFNKTDKSVICFPQNRSYVYDSKTYDIPEGILKIADSAFQGAVIGKLRLPASLTEIDGNPFVDNLISEYEVAQGNPSFYSVEGILYTIDGKLISYPLKRRVNELVLPESCTEIGEKAFYNSTHFFSDPKQMIVEMPQSVQKIGESAFEGCRELVSINIPGSIERIEKSCFTNCLNLKNVTILNGVKHIGEEAFYRCEKLEKIELPESVLTIEGLAFSDCKGLKELYIPSNVAEIDRSAFWECPNLMITVEKGSHAAELLEEFGVHYTYKDNLDWLN